METSYENANNGVSQQQDDEFNTRPGIGKIVTTPLFADLLQLQVREREQKQHEHDLAHGNERLKLVLIVVEVGRVDLVIRVDEAGVGEFEHQQDHGEQVDVWVEEGEFHEHRTRVVVDPGCLSNVV